MKIYLPSVEDIITIHTAVIRTTGGSDGLREAGALAMCASKPSSAFGGKDVYAGVFEKAAAALECIARNHAFVDGNKRTAFMTALAIVERNGYRTSFDNADIIDTMVQIVVEKHSIERITTWMQTNSSQI